MANDSVDVSAFKDEDFTNVSFTHHEADEYYDDNTDDVLQDMPEFLKRYDAFHYSIHGYLTLFIIFIGTIGNIISMVVLTRKSMTSSISIILTSLAFADMMVLLSYLVKIKFHSDLEFMSYTEVTYSLASFCLFVSHCYVLFHTASVWLTVLVAVWRVMAVCYPAPTLHLRSPFRAKVAIVCTYASCTLVCIPEYLNKSIGTHQDENGVDKFVIENSEVYLKNRHFFDSFDDWGFNIILYLMPCVPLMAFTVVLVRNIYRNKKKLQELGKGSVESDPKSDRLTAILVIILVVFLVAKVPPGVMYVLDFGLGYKIVHQVHYVFSGTINTLILINSTVNSYIYLGMSSQYRAVAYDVFCWRLIVKARNLKLAPHRKQPQSEIELNSY